MSERPRDSGAGGTKTGVLFVCLGNICRSPLAEAIFIELARRRGVLDRFRVDSCGTGGWHVGGPADARSVEVARRHGIPLNHTARRVDPGTDFARFDWLIAMDRSNAVNLKKLGAPEEKIRLMRSFDPQTDGLDVPDPYGWDGDGFQATYDLLMAACRGLLGSLLRPGEAGGRG
jgi:protein-tyrosine phosphatase